MKLVVSVCGMEHNPISFLRRAEHLAHRWRRAVVASHLASVIDTIEREECQFTIAQAIAEVERVGVVVVGHVTSRQPDAVDMEIFEGAEDHVWYTAEFVSAVTVGARFSVRLAGRDVRDFVLDMESSGWWVWIGGHAG